LPALLRKPGALRNGAPFLDLPTPLQHLQRHLLKQRGGDRIMAQVLAAVPVQGLDAVLVAVELALETGAVSGEHVLNVLARLNAPTLPSGDAIASPLPLSEAPQANVRRYERLRESPLQEERRHVD
jgi:hypothetical protein